MKSTLKVLSRLFEVLDVEKVLEQIDGEIYIETPPSTSQLQDISINCISNPNGYLQNGFLNLNIHARQTESGRPDLDFFDRITEIIIPMVCDLRLNSFYYQIDDDKGIIKDQDRDYMYFYNLKLEFQTI